MTLVKIELKLFRFLACLFLIESPQLDNLAMQTLNLNGGASRDRDLLSGKILIQNVKFHSFARYFASLKRWSDCFLIYDPKTETFKALEKDTHAFYDHLKADSVRIESTIDDINSVEGFDDFKFQDFIQSYL